MNSHVKSTKVKPLATVTFCLSSVDVRHRELPVAGDSGRWRLCLVGATTAEPEV